MSLSMQSIPAPTDAQTDLPEDPIYRLSVVQYLAMVEAAILIEDDPVELLEGWLVHKLRKSPPHVFATHCVYRELERQVPQEWDVDTHALVVTEDSVPEPDVMLARHGRPDCLERHPGPGDVPLIVEVADSTLRRDRGIKRRLLARAGIPVYWIVNLIDRQIEVYTDPNGPSAAPDYRQRRDFNLDDIVPVVVDGEEVGRLAVRDLLP